MTEQDEIKPEDKIDVSSKISYGLTMFGSQAVNGVFTVALIFYFVEKLLLPFHWFLWISLFYAIWNAVNDPLFGYLSDRTKTRWGRRIPYLFVFTPLMSISFILLWLCPTVGEIGEFGVFLYVLFFICLYDTSYTATILVWSALGQEMSMDHRERGSLQIYALILGLFGTLASLFLPDIFLDEPGREGFIMLTIILAIIQFIAMEITTFKVKERLEFSYVDEPVGFIDSFKHTLKRKSFLTTVAMNFFLVFIISVFFGNLFFYADYAIPGFDSTIVLLIMVPLVIAGILFGIYFTDKINRKKGVKSAMIQAIILSGIGYFLVGILPGIFSVLGFFLVGVGIYGSMTLFNVAYGDVMDEDEVDTGRRREAAIMGMNALITKPAESVAIGFITLILFFFQYQAPIGGIQQVQSDFTILGIKLAMGIIPAIVSFLAAFIFSFNPLHGDHLKEIKAKMAVMHLEKKEKFEIELKKK